MSDEVDELSSEARALLAAAAGGDDPSARDRARVRRALMVTVAGGAGVAASSAASGAAASAAGTGVVTTSAASLTLKIAAVVLVVAGGAAVVAPWPEAPSPPSRAPSAAIAREHDEPRAVAVRRAPAEVAAPEAPLLEPAPPPAPPPAIEPAPPPARATRNPRPRTSVTTSADPPEAPSASTLAAEVALLRSVHAALNAGDPDTALARLAEHARRFPNGAMSEEREAARVLALCRAGRRDDARAAADRFLRERPSSPLAARVRASCE